MVQSDDDGDDEHFLPLTDQRVFGAGIPHKKIDFVPASIPDTSLTGAFPTRPNNVGARYLSIVMPQASDVDGKSTGKSNPAQADLSLCTICKQPLSTSNDELAPDYHESSIAHQVCLEHSYQPSHLDRERVGIKYLSAYGWDVDSRTGLGSRGEGIRIPIKVKEKNDTAGLRETVDEDEVLKLKNKTIVKKEEKVIRLNGKESRRREAEEKKRAERLRQAFYGPDLSQYLGPNT